MFVPGRGHVYDFRADRAAHQQRFFTATNALYIPAFDETPEDRAAREAQEASWRLESERRLEESRGARERAEALLAERLGVWAARRFRWTGKLTRPSKLWPSVRYVIQRDQKVQVVQNGRLVTELCVIPGYGEPEADRIMSVLDLLETDEMQLWEMANIFPRGTP